MKRVVTLLLPLLFFLPAGIYSQSATVQAVIDSVNQDSLIYFVRELSGDIPTMINGTPQTILSRNSYQPGNALAAEYIRQKFESYGLSTSIQSFNSNGENVIAIQPGTEYPNVKYIVCAHYDDMPPGTIAPGADDNASGTAAVIEAARILSKFSFPITIVYAAWDQEEQGLIGSDYYASQARIAGDSIMGVINMDMISYDSNNDYYAQLNVSNVGYTILITDKILEINDLYNTGMNLHVNNPGGGGSDHYSFWKYNYSAVFLFEGEMNAYYHTTNDLVQNINPEYYHRYAKLGIGTLADLGLGSIYKYIWATDPAIDKIYAVKNVDSVRFSAKFRNVDDHPFTAQLIYSSLDNTQVDSSSLKDDGMHGDSLPEDGIYGCFIPPQSSENFFNINVSTFDLQTNNYLVMQKLALFTTAGPVTLDSVIYQKNLNNVYEVKPYVRNRGTELTISGTKIRLRCSDPWVISISDKILLLSSMDPGETVVTYSWIPIEYDESSFPGYFNIEAEIIKNDQVVWTDKLEFPVAVKEDSHNPLLSYRLEQNYPNPFNPETRIGYTIPEYSNVTIKLYDILGNEIAVLENTAKPAGNYSIKFDGRSLSGGVYFYRMRAGSYAETRKMILLK